MYKPMNFLEKVAAMIEEQEWKLEEHVVFG